MKDSLTRAPFDLRNECFAAGQLIALSRSADEVELCPLFTTQ
jgi:hypothetical protein